MEELQTLDYANKLNPPKKKWSRKRKVLTGLATLVATIGTITNRDLVSLVVGVNNAVEINKHIPFNWNFCVYFDPFQRYMNFAAIGVQYKSNFANFKTSYTPQDGLWIEGNYGEFSTAKIGELKKLNQFTVPLIK